MTTILIADDHPLFREALRGAVQRLLPDAAILESDNAPSLLALTDAHPDAAHMREAIAEVLAGVSPAGRINKGRPGWSEGLHR